MKGWSHSVGALSLARWRADFLLCAAAWRRTAFCQPSFAESGGARTKPGGVCAGSPPPAFPCSWLHAACLPRLARCVVICVPTTPWFRRGGKGGGVTENRPGGKDFQEIRHYRAVFPICDPRS